MVRFGAFTFDASTRRLLRAEADVHLTRKAFDLLALLVLDAPRVVTKTELHGHLWPATFVSEATLVGLIKELRRALDDHDRSAPVIRTVHGVGYAFTATVERLPDRAAGTSRHWVDVNGRHIRLEEGENVIGRDPSSRIWVDLATISRRHARILVRGEGALLEDLGSKNRTKVDETAVDGQVWLKDGDRIQVGSILVVYRSSPSSIATQTQES